MVDEADIPPTRKHDSLEPAGRASRLSIDNIPTGFPDDGPLATLLRQVDHHVGVIELGLLIAILGAVVLVGSLSALSGHIFHHQIGQWWEFVVRKGTFAIAMLGAAYATHEQRHLAMDLISRRISPRGRLVLALVLKLFTIAITASLLYAGMLLHSHEPPTGPQLDLLLGVLTQRDVIVVISIGAALIIFHSAVHAAIDIEYLVRGKVPPEQARRGH